MTFESKVQNRQAGENHAPTYWRSLNELAAKTELDEFVHREFPGEATALLDPASRRRFLKLMGASMMLAGLDGCARQPQEKIVPYVRQPEEAVPGKPSYFATAMTHCGYGFGVVATSFEGRPTKIEGLKGHPSSLGATGLHAQASILDLYDPDRLDTVIHLRSIGTWNNFASGLSAALEALEDPTGGGLRILTETVTSPTLAWQLGQVIEKYPNAQWHQYDPLGRQGVLEGAKLAFGEYVDTVYDFERAKTVLSLDADFLTEGPGHVRYARDFAAGRDAEANGGEMSRLYMAECSPSLTGAKADNKLGLRYPEVETLTRFVAQKLGVPGIDVNGEAPPAVPEDWVEAVAQDLKDHAGKSIVLAGERQPAIVHAIAHAINHHLGNTRPGAVVLHIDAVEAAPTDQRDSLARLVGDMNAGKVELLLMLGGNPVYNAPLELDSGNPEATFVTALDKVKLRIHLTEAANETSRHCHWVIPETHYLEVWSDVRGYDGTTSIVQPLIAPLYRSHSVHEFLAVILGEDNASGHDIVRKYWRTDHGEAGFERFWKTALGKGLIPGTAQPPKPVTIRGEFPPAPAAAPSSGIEIDILFQPDPNVLDGRFANNGWLQELSKPLTKLTWENAVHIHPSTAARLELKHEDRVELEFGGRRVTAPILLQFGHPLDAITVHLGYGRTHCGRVGTGIGFNAFALQKAQSPWFGTGVSLRKLSGKHLLARTEELYDIEASLPKQAEKAHDRHLIREATLKDYLKEEDFAQKMGHPEPSAEHTLYKAEQEPYAGYAWGMTIDLNRCTGCNVCVVACQSENNIAVVGKDEVRKGREMQWIRIDRYYKGGFENGPAEVVHQPIPCMQCENAPCEPVCPVGATSHSHEGLNDMTYNRCVGTRYCANNCPYKVRRFNFFKYSDHKTPQLKMMRNPNVTVRSRGVMEKCTYCVQRINLARIDAKRDGRTIQDGAIVTACQAACPSQAIIFGDINDASSRVAKSKLSPRNYSLLGDVGTRPRTTYLAKLNNPSPALAGSGASSKQTKEHH